MCDVCGCELPINRSGHVTREIRRTHKAGAKHQAALARRAEEHERAAEANLRRLQREWAEGARQRRAACIHALTLGLLITRLRAKHGSMAEARNVWAHEADARLNAMEMPALQAQLLRPAKQALALIEIRELMRVQDHELLRILMEKLGW